jgi:hypothetical protein
VIYGDFVEVISKAKVETLSPHLSIDYAIEFERGYNLPFGRIDNFVEWGGTRFTQLLELKSRAQVAGSWF